MRAEQQIQRGTGVVGLTASGVSGGYRGLAVVRDIDLDVHLGEVACVVGPNGSGKSTLLKTLAGVIAPLAGTIAVGERDVTGLATQHLVKAGVGYIPQVNDVFAPLTVRENIELGGYTLPRGAVGPAFERVVAQFPRLANLLDRHAGRLSGGERKLVAMARVLMADPTVLLLDEPTAGLTEPAARQLIEGTLVSLARSGVAILLVEQRAELAMGSADWAYVMASGTVRHRGAGDALRSDPHFTQLFLGAPPPDDEFDETASATTER